MQIQFSIDGGFAVFPGLARPVTIDVDSLPAAEAATLRAAVAKADFFGRAEPAVAGGGADTQTYVVAIDDGGRTRTLRIPESDHDPDLAALVGLLDERRRSALKR
ncbi:MAG: protealysin inhibitor emfourin [Burkholderiaceae bacterium]